MDSYQPSNISNVRGLQLSWRIYQVSAFFTWPLFTRALARDHACPQPVSGGIVYIKYCVCKIRHLVLCTMTTTDGRQYLLNIFCMSTETDRLSTGMVRRQFVLLNYYDIVNLCSFTLASITARQQFLGTVDNPISRNDYISIDKDWYLMHNCYDNMRDACKYAGHTLFSNRVGRAFDNWSTFLVI